MGDISHLIALLQISVIISCCDASPQLHGGRGRILLLRLRPLQLPPGAPDQGADPRVLLHGGRSRAVLGCGGLDGEVQQDGGSDPGGLGQPRLLHRGKMKVWPHSLNSPPLLVRGLGQHGLRLVRQELHWRGRVCGLLSGGAECPVRISWEWPDWLYWEPSFRQNIPGGNIHIVGHSLGSHLMVE